MAIALQYSKVQYEHSSDARKYFDDKWDRTPGKLNDCMKANLKDCLAPAVVDEDLQLLIKIW